MMMKQLTPILYVRSIEDAVAFYRDKLGFELGFSMPGPDGRMAHASVKHGDVELMIGYKMGTNGSIDMSGLGGGPELYISMDGVDDYHAYVRDTGAPVTAELTDQFWGDRTFTVTDPDGHVLTFAQTVRQFDPARDMPVAAPA